MADFRISNENLCKEIRTQLLDKFTKTDCEIEQTTSWPDGLHEDTRFMPSLPRPVRRTDSADDIEKYQSYFSLAQKNQGEDFTWKDYCNILQDELRNSDVFDAFNKMSIQPSGSHMKSDALKSATVAGSGSPMNTFLENPKQKKRSFLDIDDDVESLSSLDDAKSVHTPSKNVLKKMCTEIRSLAQKTCKTVEKMTAKRYCSACGEVIGSSTVHRKCSKQRIKKIDCNKPITPNMLKSTNLAKNRIMSFQSPMMTPSGTGVYLTDSHTKKLQRKPLFQAVIKKEK